MKSRILSLVFIIFIALQSSAQDFAFSQFYETPMLRNPALAGIMQGNLRVAGAYRSQWSSVTVPYLTQAFSTELRAPLNFRGDYCTFGVQLTNDLAGDSKLGRMQILPAFNFHKALTNDMNKASSYLNFSVMGGYTQSQFDPSKLVFGSQFQPGGTAPAINRTNISYGDLSTGLSFSSNNMGAVKYYVGVAAFHLLRTKSNFFNNDDTMLKPRYVLNGGFNMQTGQNDRFYVYTDLMSQGGNRQWLLGLIYKYSINGYNDDDEEIGARAICFGGSLRWADAFIPSAKLIWDHFYIGTSYDINISKLKAASQLRGGFEFTGGYVANLNMLSVPNQVCPGF